MSLTFDHVAGGPVDADLAAVVQHPEAHAGRLVRLGVDQHDVREVDGRLPLDDAAGLPHPGGLGVALGDVHALHHRTVLLRAHGEHLALLALVGAGDDHHAVAFLDARGHYRTSGASEMIFMNFLPRSSRTTGPKMRVPIGSCCLLISTAALRSKRIALPSGRRTGNEVRTMTA